MKKTISFLIYTALLITIPPGVFLLVPAEVQYHVTEKYTFAAEVAGKNIYLAVMLPKDNPYQDVDCCEIKWGGEISREDFGEVQVIKLSDITNIEPAVLEYDLVLYQGVIEWAANPRPDDYLPQKNIESGSPVLQTKAKELCSNPEDAEFQTYKFTSSYLSWPEETRLGGGQSALAAYKNRIGACGEFANLMTALNRACGNPARSINGIIMPLALPPQFTAERTWMHPGGAHAWVEIYHQNRWVIADPSRAANWPFDRLWFGRSQGQYLSYGETGTQEKIYQGMVQWAEKKGTIIGAMSAPIKFVSAIETKHQAAITPFVSIKKIRDSRWTAAGCSVIVIIGAAVIIEKLAARKKSNLNSSPKPPAASSERNQVRRNQQ